jgi:hypothetical protein
MFPISQTDFHVPLNADAHPTSGFGKFVRRNLSTPTIDHKNKLKSVVLMDGYYVFGITAIPYPGFGVLINIVSKDDITYRVTIGDMPHCTCPDFTKMSSQSLRKKEKWCIANIFIMCLDFYAKWIMIMTNSFMLQRIPTTRSCCYLNLQVL